MSISVIPASAKPFREQKKGFSRDKSACIDSAKLLFDMIIYPVRLTNSGNKKRSVLKKWVKSSFRIPKSLKR